MIYKKYMYIYILINDIKMTCQTVQVIPVVVWVYKKNYLFLWPSNWSHASRDASMGRVRVPG